MVAPNSPLSPPLVRSSSASSPKSSDTKSPAPTAEEYALVTMLSGFYDAVALAAEKNEPFYVNRYVTNLARQFNKFYVSCPILKEGIPEEVKNARLKLVEAVCAVIKSALFLLGIETVESM